MMKPGLSKKESDFQKDVLQYLRKEVGGHWIKIHVSSYQLEGEPDIVGVKDGHFYAFELKQGSYQPTPLQLHKLDLINKSGGTAKVIRSLEEVRECFELKCI
jgi:Holliday junction resolvase